jgi:aspartate-semialdehyde dehydrogenase
MDHNIRVTATTVRIPVMGGHSESVNVEFENEFEMEEVRNILQNAPGVLLVDDVKNLKYPMPMDARDKDDVFVGRLRRDETQAKTLNMVLLPIALPIQLALEMVTMCFQWMDKK